MAVESASTINDLNANWPDGTETVTQGDDHLRLIKAVLKTIFPGALGTGFSKPITATEDEINFLQGLTGNVQAQLNGNNFAVGTTILFYQAAPPAGWTLVNMDATRMLVAVNAYTLGGTHDPTIMAVVPAHTHTASGGAISSAGDHTHGVVGVDTGNAAVAWTGGVGTYLGPTAGMWTAGTLVTTSAGGHTHDITGLTIGNNAGGSNWTPKYLGVIVCQKS
jgi:hypothetical protein